MALSSILLASAVVPAAATAQPFATGLSGLDNYDPIAIQQARTAGVKTIRISLLWAGVAPAIEPSSWNPADPADPNYNWGETDAAVKATVEAGLIPVVTVEGAPPWAQRCHLEGEQANRLCDPDPTALAAFATALARRYNGDFEGLPAVRYWQGLNEPNLSLYFNPQYEVGKAVSPGLYRLLANSFYSAIKGVNPSNLVLMAGLGPIRVKRLTIGPMEFARLLLCMQGRKHPKPTPGNCGGGVDFDIFDVHPYTTGSPIHKGGPDDVQLGDLGKLHELLRAADRAGRINGAFAHTPLWITEFSWDSKPPDPGGLSMNVEARWTAEALHRAWLAGVSEFFWFGLTDLPPEGRTPHENIESGLYFRGATVSQDRPKKVMYAFRFPFVAESKRNGFSFWGRTPTSAGGRIAIQVQEGRRWRKVAVARANSDGIFEGSVRTSYGRNRHGTVRAIYGREKAIPFSLDPIKDFYQPPFGRPTP